MYAVIKTGGKQYRVATGDVITVEKMAGEAGETVQVGDVLMLGEDGKAPTVGTPLVDKAAVFAEIVEQARADKILVFKKKRRHNYRRLKGHRQAQTVLKISEISPTGTKPKAAAKKSAPKKAEAKAEDAAPAPAKEEAKADEAAPQKAEAKKPAAKKPAAKKPAAKKPAAKKDDEA